MFTEGFIFFNYYLGIPFRQEIQYFKNLIRISHLPSALVLLPCLQIK